MKQFDRTILALGEDQFSSLTKANVLVVGVGGVGGYVAEFLVRTGIQNITIVDFDVIDETNLNRQIIALNNNIGNVKVEELKQRLININKNLNIVAINQKVNKDNIDSLITSQKFDYIIDAIDSKIDKADLIAAAKEKNIPIISSMGAGNRVGIPQFEITDIFKTQYDGLAKAMRKLLRERKVESLDVCVCKQQSIKTNGKIGSVVYFPACAAAVICGYVIDKLKTLWIIVWMY